MAKFKYVCIIREDIFWGKGKDINEATEEERIADLGERSFFLISVIIIFRGLCHHLFS